MLEVEKRPFLSEFLDFCNHSFYERHIIMTIHNIHIPGKMERTFLVLILDDKRLEGDDMVLPFQFCPIHVNPTGSITVLTTWQARFELRVLLCNRVGFYVESSDSKSISFDELGRIMSGSSEKRENGTWKLEMRNRWQTILEKMAFVIQKE